VLQLRLGYAAAKWRNVYKALTVLEFLVRRGSGRCVALARSELLPKLEDLEDFQFVAPDGRDQGVNVRHRCAAGHSKAAGASAGRYVSGPHCKAPMRATSPAACLAARPGRREGRGPWCAKTGHSKAVERERQDMAWLQAVQPA